MDCETGFTSLSSFPDSFYIRATLISNLSYHGLLASDTYTTFYTDESWDCRRFPDGNWSKAKSYADNNGTNLSWKMATISEIASRAHWIWTNTSNTDVECRKIFSGEN